MWAIRILTGSQAGQIFKLKSGKNRIGRAESADMQLTGAGISKDHLDIQVFSDKLIVSDLKSSNGTYLNGVRVQSAIIRLGDKLSAHNILFEVIAAPEQTYVPQVTKTAMPNAVEGTAVFSAPVISPSVYPSTSEPPPMSIAPPLYENQSGIQKYIHKVLLPGVYHLVEVFDFRTVLMGFAGFFILLVTFLSILPMKQITSDSIQTESRRRAQTVARALANANEKVIRQGDLSSFSTEFVLREDGIDDVYIVSKDGMILAPPERAGSRPKDTGFIKQIQGQTREVSEQIGTDRVGASFPIVAFDPEMQQNVPRAHAVVIFNVASLQFDDGRALGLLVQMLAIKLVTS